MSSNTNIAINKIQEHLGAFCHYKLAMQMYHGLRNAKSEEKLNYHFDRILLNINENHISYNRTTKCDSSQSRHFRKHELFQFSMS
jgi:hypothetical protein